MESPGAPLTTGKCKVSRHGIICRRAGSREALHKRGGKSFIIAFRSGLSRQSSLITQELLSVFRPSELPQTAGSSRLTAIRMFELRFLRNYGEASFRIARLGSVGCGEPKASEAGCPLLSPLSSGQAEERGQPPGCPRPKVAWDVRALGMIEAPSPHPHPSPRRRGEGYAKHGHAGQM
jgi:hypothetical protein